jgi:endonuclease/exonuclease/phosphatase family metal-dependent hydrolase
MCGADNDDALCTGATAPAEQTPPKLAILESVIESQQPNFVTLDEVCQAQLAELVADLGAPYGSSNHSDFSDQKSTPPNANRTGCAAGADGTNELGNGLLSKTALTDESGNVPLDGNDPDAHIKCATASDAFSTHICFTHISPNSAFWTDEDSNAAKFAFEGYDDSNDGRNHTILAGDFNVGPGSPDLDPIYSKTNGTDSSNNAGSGHFEEVDECPSTVASSDGNARHDYNESNDSTPDTSPCDHTTHHDAGSDPNPRKLDYIFLQQSYFENTSVSRSPTNQDYTVDHSDHLMLIGTATECSVTC